MSHFCFICIKNKIQVEKSRKIKYNKRKANNKRVIRVNFNKLSRILFLIILIINISICPMVYAAGAYESAPGYEGPIGAGGDDAPPYSPGEENQQNQKEEEEEKKDEEAEENKETLTDEEKKAMTAEEILDYIKRNYTIEDGASVGDIGKIDESQDVKEAWVKTLEEAGYRKDDGTEEGSIVSQLYDRTYGAGHTIYTNQPEKSDSQNAGTSLDDMFNDAEDFINSGTTTYGDSTSLQNFSNTIYNILLAVGVAVAVIVGAIIGIKLMASNIDTKVEAKNLLIPYVVGCIVVFGGFGIWKIVVTILQNM